MADLAQFPTDWRTALVLVAHPDDPEYGPAAAVAGWTRAGRQVSYGLASSGEAGIEGMPPAQAGPLREAEQRASAEVVGVHDVAFWGFPDSEIRNTATLRAAVTDAIGRLRPDVIVSTYGGPEWAPGAPNQRDHMEFAAAVLQAYDELDENRRPRWLFQNGPTPTHVVDVADDIDIAVRSLAQHHEYLSVLDPETPVDEQARQVIDMVTTVPDGATRRVIGFELLRHQA